MKTIYTFYDKILQNSSYKCILIKAQKTEGEK